jgi:tetratricopeptide (TPR) repeat protein
MRSIQIILCLATSLILFSCSSIPQPNLRTPSKEARTHASDDSLMFEANELKDAAEVNLAIKKYKEILGQNPNNALAMIEIASAYKSISNYDSSFAYLNKAIEYKSDHLLQVYQLLGASYEELEEYVYAEQVYRKGIRHKATYQMQFRLAKVQLILKKYYAAEKNFVETLKLNPYHIESNFELSVLYSLYGRRFPSLFASLRYLTLAPKGKYAEDAYQNFINMALSGVSKQGNAKVIHVDTKKDTEFLMLSIMHGGQVAAGAFQESINKKDELMLSILLFEDIFPLILVQNDSFISNYYLSFFRDLNKAGYNDIFAFYILQCRNIPAVNKWLRNNSDKVAEFEKWINNYKYEF